MRQPWTLSAYACSTVYLPALGFSSTRDLDVYAPVFDTLKYLQSVPQQPLIEICNPLLPILPLCQPLKSLFSCPSLRAHLVLLVRALVSCIAASKTLLSEPQIISTCCTSRISHVFFNLHCLTLTRCHTPWHTYALFCYCFSMQYI